MCLTHRSYSHKIIMSLNTLQIACLITSLEQYESIIKYSTQGCKYAHTPVNHATKVLTKTFILDKFYNKENLRHDWSF